MLNQKETIIMKFLYSNLNLYVTSQEIAAELQVSDRTARKYLHLLGEKLPVHHAKLEAKQGKGYQLTLLDEQAFEKFYQSELLLIPTHREITSIHESKDRQYFLLNQLFFGQRNLFMDDLAEKLYVSRSTISNDLVEVKKLLKPYEIEIRSKPGKGVYIFGNEQHIRHFIMNYFFMNRLQDNLYTFTNYTNFLEGISIEEIVIIVLDACRESHLGLSDFIIFNIVLHIGLAIKRIQAGFEIQLDPMREVDRDAREYQTALTIIHRLEESLRIEFPLEEAGYIAMHLQNKVTTKRVFSKLPYTEEQIRTQLIQALANIDEEAGFLLHQDTLLIDGLMLHLTPLVARLQNQTSIENPLLEEIQSKYLSLLDLTIRHFSSMAIFENFVVTESEWAYMTIHLIAGVERFFNSQKARVIVLCATGLGSSQMLRVRLEHELGSKILIERVISYYEISEQLLEGIDLIISSIHLPNVMYAVPVVHVSVFLDENDIQAINYGLSKLKGTRKLMLSKKAAKDSIHSDAEEQLRSVFTPSLFIYFDKKASKEEILTQLISKINQLEVDDISTSLAQQLRLRESYSTVAFSPYLAVPHPIEAVTQAAHVAIAVVPEGIYWDELNREIQLVILMSPDTMNQQRLEKISKLLVSIIENDCLRQNLVTCQSYEAFLRVFTRELN